MAEKKNEIKEVAEKNAELVVNNAFINSLAAQIEEKCKYGMTFPKDYNVVNSLTGAYLTLKETTDRSGKCVLETCSKASIANALMDMVTMGLSMQKKQCYPIAYGGKLNCQVSYHGHKAMAHRYGAVDINAEVIYEGDTFEYHIENGRKVLDKHEQNFMNINLDKILGAYCVIKLSDGSTYMEVMNMNQIKTAWKKGFGYKEGSGTHKEFTDMMAKKTVTSRACKQIVQQYGDIFVTSGMESAEKLEDVDVIVEDVKYDIEQNANTEEFVMDDPIPVEEVVEVAEVIDVEEPEFMK